MLTDLCNTSDWKTAPCWSFFFSFFQWEHLSWGQVLCLVPSLQTAIQGNPCRCRGLQGSTPPRKEWATQRLLGTAFQAECPEQGAGGKHLAAVCGWGREEGGEILGQPATVSRTQPSHARTAGNGHPYSRWLWEKRKKKNDVIHTQYVVYDEPQS